MSGPAEKKGRINIHFHDFCNFFKEKFGMTNITNINIWLQILLQCELNFLLSQMKYILFIMINY